MASPIATQTLGTLAINTRGWNRQCARAELVGADAVAAHLGVDRSTLYRITAGKTAPGPKFIAAALQAFPSAKFEELFTVTQKVAA